MSEARHVLNFVCGLVKQKYGASGQFNDIVFLLHYKQPPPSTEKLTANGYFCLRRHKKSE